MRQMVRWLAVASAFGMFLVLVMGATVTNTGSAEGCGRSWPLCNGRFIPELATATLIEFSHRAVTGIEGILVVALAIGAWLYWRQYREIQILVPLMLVTLVLQAGLGAWAVLYPQTPAVLATHFGISLICFASTYLIATFILQADRLHVWRRTPPPPGFLLAVGLITLYVLVVVYIGAYVRHTNAQLACIDWPLCNGSLFPGFTGPVGIVFGHRVSALVALIALAALWRWARQTRAARPDLDRASALAFGLVLAQSISGALIVFTRLNLFSALFHAAIVALLFATLTYLLLHSLTRAPRAAPVATSAHPQAAQPSQI